MKKTLAIILVVLALASTLVACGSGSSIIGSWTTTQEGITMDITFENGGKGSVSTMGVDVDMEWSIEGGKLTATMSMMGQEQDMFKDATYSVNGNELSITYEGETAVFTKK